MTLSGLADTFAPLPSAATFIIPTVIYLYFEHYATHIIPAQCRTGHLGYVVSTTMQEGTIAEDALETLGLIASVASTFYARWADCMEIQTSENKIRYLSRGTLAQT